MTTINNKGNDTGRRQGGRKARKNDQETKQEDEIDN